MRSLERVDVVVLDCDSTLSAIEGIDELGSDRREQIEALTDAAMRGELPLEAVYARRLDLIRPTRARVQALAEQYVRQLVPDARATVDALRSCGIEVRIMSGGLLPAVRAVGAELGIPEQHVAAVAVQFDGDAYAGFDASPLTRTGGKLELMREWRAELQGRVMFVGDGVTDLEAYEAVDVFVAYAGVTERERVTAGADVVIRSLSLAPVLPLALGGERPTSSGDAVFDRGLQLLDEQYQHRLPNLNR